MLDATPMKWETDDRAWQRGSIFIALVSVVPFVAGVATDEWVFYVCSASMLLVAETFRRHHRDHLGLEAVHEAEDAISRGDDVAADEALARRETETVGFRAMALRGQRLAAMGRIEEAINRLVDASVRKWPTRRRHTATDELGGPGELLSRAALLAAQHTNTSRARRLAKRFWNSLRRRNAPPTGRAQTWPPQSRRCETVTWTRWSRCSTSTALCWRRS